MNLKRRFLLYAVLAGAFATTTVARAGVFENLETAEEAYIYAFPMIAAYKAMDEKESRQLADPLHPEGIAGRGEGIELAPGAGRPDLPRNAPLLAEGNTAFDSAAR